MPGGGDGALYHWNMNREILKIAKRNLPVGRERAPPISVVPNLAPGGCFPTPSWSSLNNHFLGRPIFSLGDCATHSLSLRGRKDAADGEERKVRRWVVVQPADREGLD